MTKKITDLVGYRFDVAKGSWLAAFFIGAAAITSDGQLQTQGHYELLPLEDVKSRLELAIKDDDIGTAIEYQTAMTSLKETIAAQRGAPVDLPAEFNKQLYSAASTGDLYHVVNPVADYDWTAYQLAQKTAEVKAEFVPAGTKVETIMANGHVETTKTAGPDGGYKVTNPTGEEYLVDPAKFSKVYEETDVAGIFRPRPDIRKVIPVVENIAFTAPWGEEMKIQAGGVLVHGGRTDVYGIQAKEFSRTYSMV